jgi:hypothetical protein
LQGIGIGHKTAWYRSIPIPMHRYNSNLDKFRQYSNKFNLRKFHKFLGNILEVYMFQKCANLKKNYCSFWTKKASILNKKMCSNIWSKGTWYWLKLNEKNDVVNEYEHIIFFKGNEKLMCSMNMNTLFFSK